MIHKGLSAYLGVLLLLSCGVGALAAEIRPGATMQVKANSIWFQEVGQLTRWQQLMRSGNAAALAAYQKKVLGNRDAWQFIHELTVAIRSYEPQKTQVNVEMKTEGRMLGTTWWLDVDALKR